MPAPNRCRLCGSPEIRDFGAIAGSDYFAGRVMERAESGARLWRCDACHSLFRDPLLRPAEYLARYADGAAGQWAGNHKRSDFRLIAAIVAERPGARRLLDIGCGSGDFLASLAPAIEKFGIEPSPAAQIAKERGVVVCAGTVQQLGADKYFDVVTAIDVIEHIADVEAFLTCAYAHVAPGGLLVIATGDPECRVWCKLFKSRFWYSSFPEHVSFPSVEFFRSWSARIGAGLVTKRTLRHQEIGFLMRTLYVVAQLGYAISPAAFNLIGRLAGGVCGRPHPRRRCFSPGIPGAFVDHQVVVIARPPPANTPVNSALQGIRAKRKSA